MVEMATFLVEVPSPFSSNSSIVHACLYYCGHKIATYPNLEEGTKFEFSAGFPFLARLELCTKTKTLCIAPIKNQMIGIC